MKRERIIARIKIKRYLDNGKVMYLAKIKTPAVNISFNETTLNKLFRKMAKEM